MNQPFNQYDALVSSIFSDETALFRSPAEPEPWDAVSVYLRVMKGAPVTVTLLAGFPAARVRMWKVRSDARFDWYEGKLYCKDGASIFYTFLVEWQGHAIHYRKCGPVAVDAEPIPQPAEAFCILPGFHVPEWARGAVQYQIFPDRFCNGDPANDVTDREYRYNRAPVRHAESWDALPGGDDYRCFYGGDLRGVLDKLDYLQSLGVEAIYFNPIFVSPSSHGYDTQDYAHVDPHLTTIAHDGGEPLPKGARTNRGATRYIQRTTDPENLAASDAWFADFCRELHRRGMRIILDGVFNHCGSFGPWMDREGLYGGTSAYGNPKSPNRGFFRFEEGEKYECWWDVETMPKLCYEQSQRLCEEIYHIAEKWAAPPYSIDGWRLDVAADLGHSPVFNHLFWKEFRRRVKAVNPEILIVAEHYGDPSPWLQGDEWDTVMNYDAFMEPVTFFLTGMEKHSDYRRDDLYQNGGAFFDMMQGAMARLPGGAIQCAMNELSNHDHSRFMTRTSGRPGRLNSHGSAAAGEGIRPGVFREAAVIQMTWPGAPTIYYGDEAGLVGWTDPDNRRTYPWGHEDEGLIAMYRALSELRRALPVLRRGSVKPLCAGHGYIAYGRFDGEGWAATACNNTGRPVIMALPLRDIGVTDGTAVVRHFSTDPEGFDPSVTPVGRLRDGVLNLEVPPYCAVVLTE